jgi:hypothetical protein
MMDAAIQVRRFDQPDDCLDMKDAGAIKVLKMADGTTGMACCVRARVDVGKRREAAAA